MTNQRTRAWWNWIFVDWLFPWLKAAVPRDVGVQQLRRREHRSHREGSLVLDVRQDLHLHKQVRVASGHSWRNLLEIHRHHRCHLNGLFDCITVPSTPSSTRLCPSNSGVLSSGYFCAVREIIRFSRQQFQSILRSARKWTDFIGWRGETVLRPSDRLYYRHFHRHLSIYTTLGWENCPLNVISRSVPINPRISAWELEGNKRIYGHGDGQGKKPRWKLLRSCLRTIRCMH